MFVFLYVISLITFAVAAVILGGAESAFHEMVAGLAFVCSAVLFAGAVVSQYLCGLTWRIDRFLDDRDDELEERRRPRRRRPDEDRQRSTPPLPPR